ncbi:MAG: DUF520 family protein [Acidiferrobacterales bacterium]|nr:DUF520 family protein [Acidiferrobacterales bacterium]
MVATTLGTGRDAQIIDAIEGERKEQFMLHYNFPPFCVGETGFVGSPKRREIGHGKLAKRGIELGHLEWGKIETANQRATRVANVREGIDKDLAKKIVKMIKDSKLKVQAAIQGDQVRISGKKRDDLQQVISLLKNAKLELPLQYINFRD